jgi:hypothetical protein
MGICVLYGAFCRQVQPELQFEVCSARELAITE